MKPKRIAVLAAILALVLIDGSSFTPDTPFATSLQAQSVVRQGGQSELGLMLRRLNTSGVFMMATAHPDDEDNALLTMLSRGQGIRAALVTATRGDGGQNEIGPELFDALAVLRTEELLAAHRLDGAEQYFTRAVDFGYSFSIEETFEKWGRQEILGDFVRMIRTIRPDVITGLSSEGQGGGQHHQASGVLAQEAFRAAADPTQFPDQIEAGLRPWQAKKFYVWQNWYGFRGRGGEPGGASAATIDVGGYDPLLGRTYAEIGHLARSMHKCQGMSQLITPPGAAVSQYRLVDTIIPGRAGVAETSLFDGVDTTIAGLAQYAGSRAPTELTMGLASIALHAEKAAQRFPRDGSDAITEPILAGLKAVHGLRAQLGSLGLDEDARFEIDFRLEAKEREFEEAAILAHGLRLEALANDGLVTPGQPVTISVLVANHGKADVGVSGVTFAGFDDAGPGCRADVVKVRGVYNCSSQPRIPADAKLSGLYFKRLPDAARYAFEPDVPFGLPFRPTPFLATFELEFSSARISIEVPVQHRYEGDIFSGEKRMELKVVPRFAVRVTPGIAIIPHAAREGREVRVTVTNSGRDSAEGEVMLELPSGWRTTPERVPVRFTREDEEQAVRLAVVPGAATRPGEYRIRAVVESSGQRVHHGYQVVEYPHTGRRHLFKASETIMKVIDVEVAPDLTVGYVKGSGDEMPAAMEQLGARVDMIDADQLAWGDLSRYNVIVTGVRAYELRTDLRANNDRLMDYVEQGGTLIVQYNKFKFNDAQYGPYPVRVSRNRVTDESAPVELLVPDHPMFTFPNRIDDGTWAGWVQERGLYFLGQKDPTYVDLVQLEDSFESNSGIKRGALVEARAGDGRWIYLGLGLWRQLPAGTTGAYQLLANLISLGGELQ